MNVNLINVPLSSHKIVKKTVEDFFLHQSINRDGVVNISFVSQFQIRNLNKKYRQVNRSTDVLSFPIWKDIKEIPKKGKVALGDIFICPKETEIDKNLSELISHSLNHLIGKHH